MLIEGAAITGFLLLIGLGAVEGAGAPWWAAYLSCLAVSSSCLLETLGASPRPIAIDLLLSSVLGLVVLSVCRGRASRDP